jgi:hypothetical protein
MLLLPFKSVAVQSFIGGQGAGVWLVGAAASDAALLLLLALVMLLAAGACWLLCLSCCS